MTQRQHKGFLVGGSALTLVLAMLPTARGQDLVLPEIVVTSPSPILTRPGTPQPSLGEFPVGVLPVVRDAFAPVTVVPRNEIERNRPQTLGDALFEKPGVSASTYAPGAASRPIIRGLDNFRVRVQENGIGVQDVSELGEDHAVPINPLVNDRLEVIRGPATLRYGSQAIGGVVSAENNRVPTFVPLNGIIGRISGGLNSVDRGRDAAATIDAGHGNVAFHADGFKTEGEDYRTPRGRQLNSAREAQGGAVGMSYVSDRGFVGVSFSHYDSLYGIPGGEAALSRTRLDPTQDKVLTRGEYRPEAGPFEAVRFWLGGSTYKHNESSLDELGIEGVNSTFKNREAEGRLEAQHVPVLTGFGTLTGAVGVQTGRRELSTKGESFLDPTDSRNVAGYLFEQLDFGSGFKLQAAGRIERSRVAGTATQFPSTFLPTFTNIPGMDPDTGEPVDIATPDDPTQTGRRRKFAPKSASFGALQDLPFGFVASLNGQYVERAPAAPELYSRGPHDATFTFEIGDPNLKIERARTIEFGVRRAEGPLRLDAATYYTRYTGFIFKRDTGIRCGDEFTTCGQEGETELQQIVYAQQNAEFYGAEVGAQLDVIPVRTGFIGIDAQYDFVRAKFDDGTNVPRIPPHRLGGGLFWRDAEAGWFARVGLLHAFDQTRTAPFETFTNGYNLLKAELSYTHRFTTRSYGLSELTIGLVGNNLLDDDVRNHASFKKDEVLLPGRSARLFVSARF